MKQVVLIDGKWLAYKMHFSHLNLKFNGMPTGMLYGFLGDLLRINKKLPEARIIVCWDGEKKTWRHKAYPAYKANRSFNPEFERMQKGTGLVIPFLRLLGLWVLQIDDVEADDMIGMVASIFSKQKDEVRIYSKDREVAWSSISCFVRDKSNGWRSRRRLEGTTRSWFEDSCEAMASGFSAFGFVEWGFI